MIYLVGAARTLVRGIIVSIRKRLRRPNDVFTRGERYYYDRRSQYYCCRQCCYPTRTGERFARGFRSVGFRFAPARNRISCSQPNRSGNTCETHMAETYLMRLKPSAHVRV